MPSSSQSVERSLNKSIPGCKKPFNLPICFEIMCIFANEFGALFCVSFHPEIDPICLNQQKEELLDLKRQRADTETRERACNICLTSETKGLWHLSQSLFARCFLGLISRPSWEGEGALAILTLIVAIISAQWPPGCPLMMVGDSAEGFLTAWNRGHRNGAAVKFAAKPGQVPLSTTQMSPPTLMDWLYVERTTLLATVHTKW